MSNCEKLLYIEWDDHSSFSNSWMSRKQLANGSRPARCVSVGIVVAETKDCITLAGTWGAESEVKADQTIIKSCIRKRRILRHK